MTNRNKQLTSLFLLIGALIATLGAAALIVQRQARLRGAFDGLPGDDLPARVPVLGVNVELTLYSPAELEENLDLIDQTGFVWLRQAFAWDEIEAEQGIYDWSAYDQMVEEVAAREMKLVAVLWQSPEWAANSPTAPPDDLDAFADFTAALAERYGDQIDVYQIWDEPNLESGWGGSPPSAIDYAALLEAAYGAIHAADSEAMVLTAGLAPTIETGPKNISDVLYLRALYENGAGEVFDGAAGKPYGFDSGPDDRRVNKNLLNFSRMVLLREVMIEYGDASKPLWASHFGWNALPEGWAGDPSAWGQVSAGQQAVQTIAAYERALNEWPWSGALILDGWQPDVLADDARWGFALRDQNGELSPLAEAIQSRSAGFNTALWPGRYPAQSAPVDYNGEWEFSELGADIMENGGSTVDLDFVGDQLAVTARRDNYRAYLYVEIDGEPSVSLPRDERGAYLVLTSPDLQPQVETLPVATGLDDGAVHHAHIEAERGWDQWALAGFAVGAKVDTTGYDILIGALALLAIALVVFGFRAGRGAGWRGAVDKALGWIGSRVGDSVHFLLTALAGLTVWIGAALTWGGLIPDVLRRLGDGPSLVITALTAGVFYFSPWLVLTIIALIVYFLLIVARPGVGLALIVFFAPYFYHPRPLFDRAFSMVEITSLLTLVAWAIHIIGSRKVNGWPSLRYLWGRMTSLDKAVGLFAALCVVSISWANLTGVAVTELRQIVIEPMVLYVVMRTFTLTRREQWRIADMFVLAGVIVAVIGLGQYVTGTNLITAEAGIPRLRSVYNSPNGAALFLGRTIPVAAAVALIGGEKWRRWLYGAAVLIMIGAMGLTLSKGGLLLALPAAIGMVVVLWLGRRGLILVGVGAALEGLALIPLSRIPRFKGLFDFTSGTSTSFFRLQLWKSAVQMIKEHPLTGVGLDQFLYAYRGRYIQPEAWQEPNLSTPHNFILSFWTRLGFVGVAVVVWMQVAFWRMAWCTQKRLKDGNESLRALVIGLMGSMAAFVAHGLVDEPYFLIDMAFVFFMTLGLMHQIGEGMEDGSIDQQPDTALS
ncbi:MAG: O-antigen ligase family protein [Anaerolineae bacterium]|nr:O-antigen ligase family protein [Anaerolineae bacterium]